MFIRIYIILLFSCCFAIKNIYCQPSVLLLQNPSFEDVPGFSRTPRGWFYCGEIGESPPDIHPSPDSPFGVTQHPKRGYTYVGMVVRDNNTNEALSQWLQQSMQAGQCYEFSIFAARSPYYQSVSRVTWQWTNFDRPVVLRLWGGNLNCEKAELLAVSPLIESTDWQRYIFHFQPKEYYNRLIIEAYYAPNEAPYCGNVLLDAASPILPVFCDTGKPAVHLDTITFDVNLDVATINDLAKQIQFSSVDQQLKQEAFYLPSGELRQASKSLFILSHMMDRFPDQKLIFSINESDKHLFKAKAEHLEWELLQYGLMLKQFRIQKYKSRANEAASQSQVFVTLQ